MRVRADIDPTVRLLALQGTPVAQISCAGPRVCYLSPQRRAFCPQDAVAAPQETLKLLSAGVYTF